MKSLRRPLRVVLLGVGTALIFAIPALAEQKGGQVEITDTRIEIHPGAKISDSDLRALNNVLKKYDKSLYKIETVKDGKVVTVQGKLKDAFIDTTLAAEVKQAKAAGASVQMAQLADHKQTVPPPVGGPTLISSKELIKELKPILEQYSKNR